MQFLPLRDDGRGAVQCDARLGEIPAYDGTSGWRKADDTQYNDYAYSFRNDDTYSFSNDKTYSLSVDALTTSLG